MTLAKTEAGQQVLKDRSVALTPRQRAALILVDGKRSSLDVLGATAAAGVTRPDIDKLLELGPVTETRSQDAPLDEGRSLATQRLTPRSDRTPQQRYADAY